MKFLICFPLLLSVAVAAPSQTVSIHKTLLTDADAGVVQRISDTITDLNEDMKDVKLETAPDVNADVEDSDDAAYKNRDVYEDVIVDALNKGKTDKDIDELPTRCPCIIFNSDPVCGSDIRTYRSPCMFECAKKLLGSKGTHLYIRHRGRCYRHAISPYLKIG